MLGRTLAVAAVALLILAVVQAGDSPAPEQTEELAGQGYLNWLRHAGGLNGGKKNAADDFMDVDAAPQPDYGPMTQGQKTIKRLVKTIKREKDLLSQLGNLMKNRMKGKKQPESITVHVGQVGPPGPQGPRGARGGRGRTGRQGAPGPKGIPGDRGRTGPRGSKGKPGKQGPKGIRGRRGMLGRTGRRGEVGARGPMGPQGYRGYPGPPGPPGPQGKNGRPGPRGRSGPSGPRGHRGPPGARGPTGKIIAPRLTKFVTTFATRYNGPDGRDNGFVTGRTLKFFKKVSSSSMRFLYYDNMRVYQHARRGNACRWVIKVDGRDCPSGMIAADVYIWAAANLHRPRVVMGYCKNINHGHHTMQIFVQSTPGYHADCYTGWYANQMSFTMEATEIPRAHRSLGLTYRTSYNGADGRDNGYVTYRNLNFYKSSDASVMRLMYNDNLRTHAGSGGHSCRWTIKVDGRDCSNGAINADQYIWGAMNTHRPRTVMGYCHGLKRGHHRMQIYVGHTPHYGGDCYTGWYTHQTSWTMEAEEVRMGQGPRRHYAVTKNGPMDGRDSGFINGRVLNFHKASKNTAVRLTYYDNMRTYTPGHGGKSCRWEIMVDGRSCPSGRIGGDAYVYFRKNCHRPRLITGYCKNLPAGHHQVKVRVMPTPGYHGSDCFTGWMNQAWTLETMEL